MYTARLHQPYIFQYATKCFERRRSLYSGVQCITDNGHMGPLYKELTAISALFEVLLNLTDSTTLIKLISKNIDSEFRRNI